MPILGELREELEVVLEDTASDPRVDFWVANKLCLGDLDNPLAQCRDAEDYEFDTTTAAWTLHGWRCDDVRYPDGWRDLLRAMRRQKERSS